MKKTLLLLFTPFLIFACKKDADLNPTKSQLVGTWEQERSYSYNFDQTLLPGNGQIIIIAADGSYERKRHDTLDYKGTYTLKVKKDCCERKNTLTFSTSESASGSYNYIELENEKLKLSTSCCYQDGGAVYYRRVK
ncbi:hypothetical protein HUW51_10470 [Adhaeribacter swui]|uniref:Lipocalin family protein n=1 Tax=Adhaeribacter swui TaxID=2086471 RepID=A0A7G7G7J4_9BACT|nr:hypothetical protein [Adhaeribacter swui]QNF33128.1 hypothetical protein HUW51_10470 [Adhaeribacter swui]